MNFVQEQLITFLAFKNGFWTEKAFILKFVQQSTTNLCNCSISSLVKMSRPLIAVTQGSSPFIKHSPQTRKNNPDDRTIRFGIRN